MAIKRTLSRKDPNISSEHGPKIALCELGRLQNPKTLHRHRAPCSIAATAAATLEGGGEEEEERPSKKPRVSGRERKVPGKFLSPRFPTMTRHVCH